MYVAVVMLKGRYMCLCVCFFMDDCIAKTQSEMN